MSVALTKRLLWHHLTQPDLYAAERTEQELFTWSGRQPDAREGVKAFLEKRPPRWSMSPVKDLPPLPGRRRG